MLNSGMKLVVILYGVLGILGAITTVIYTLLSPLEASAWFRKFFNPNDSTNCKWRIIGKIPLVGERLQDSFFPPRIAPDRVDRIWVAKQIVASVTFLCEDFVQMILILIILMNSGECRIIADYLFSWSAFWKFLASLLGSLVQLASSFWVLWRCRSPLIKMCCEPVENPSPEPETATLTQTSQTFPRSAALEGKRSSQPIKFAQKKTSSDSAKKNCCRAVKVFALLFLIGASIAAMKIQITLLNIHRNPDSKTMLKWMGSTRFEISSTVWAKLEIFSEEKSAYDEEPQYKHKFEHFPIHTYLYQGTLGLELLKDRRMYLKFPCPFTPKQQGVAKQSTECEITAALVFEAKANRISFNAKFVTGEIGLRRCSPVAGGQMAWNADILDWTVSQLNKIKSGKTCEYYSFERNSVPKISCCLNEDDFDVFCRSQAKVKFLRLREFASSNEITGLSGSVAGCGNPEFVFDSEILVC